MNVLALFKIIVKEFRKDFLISILLFAFIDFIYANFTGIQLNDESSSILWQGGNDAYMLGLNTILLKLLNITIVLVTVGKIADKLSDDIMIYILARISDYNKFICAYSVVVIMLGEILLGVSHMVYYCIGGFCAEQAVTNLYYLWMDALGFLGTMLLYFILNHCYSLENSFMYIIAIYALNTVLPVPVLFAISTVRFFILKSQIAVVPLFLLLVGMDLAVASFYYVLIKRRRVNIC